jgi:post-segregation antitoxin (ccd killing protein)
MTANTDKSKDRSLLGFAEEAKRCFIYLEEHEFKCVRTESTFVRWESSCLAVNVYHGRNSYEISLVIESKDDPDSYSFSEILRLVDNEAAEQYRAYASNTVEGVKDGLYQLATIFKKCVNAGIFTDNSLFSRLKLQRANFSEKYAIQIQLEQALKKSAEAWKEKNFEQFINILSPLQKHLGPVEQEKFIYARKRANNNNK